MKDKKDKESKANNPVLPSGKLTVIKGEDSSPSIPLDCSMDYRLVLKANHLHCRIDVEQNKEHQVACLYQVGEMFSKSIESDNKLMKERKKPVYTRAERKLMTNGIYMIATTMNKMLNELYVSHSAAQVTNDSPLILK